jgi:uncharacterized protein (DUF2267 family)
LTVPMGYRRASHDFDDFLAEAAEAAGLSTRHQSYTMVQGVLLAFRRRLTLVEAITFAQALPAMLRALFVAEWNPSEPRTKTWGAASILADIQGLREHHNFAPETSIANVAAALRRACRRNRL